MIIKIKEIPIFFLTCDLNGIRKKHIETEFKDMNNGKGPEFVLPILGILKCKSGVSGFIRMIEKGLMLQKYDEPFKPFILIEDDASFFDDEMRNEITLPDNADILYIGLSNCSMNSSVFHVSNYYETVDNEVVRIKHMLASHGIMICSALGASALQRTMMENWFMCKPWDVPMAYIQPYYNVYALRKPLVYQDSKFGGEEGCTKVTLYGEDHLLPNEYISKELATIYVANKQTNKFCVLNPISAGLGNILFNVISNYGFSLDNNSEFYLSNDPISTHSNKNYKDILFQDIAKMSANNVKIFQEDRFDIFKKFDINCEYYQLGMYLQNEKYFVHHRDKVLYLLRNIYDSKCDEYDYFIHIRRGDFLKFPEIHVVKLDNYYDSSIEYIKNNDSKWKDKKFIIFSDDIDWCKENNVFHNHELNISFNDNKDEFETFKYMIFSKSGGIACNSTFSWWALWLNKNKGIKILPRKWLNNIENCQIHFKDSIILNI